MHEKARWLRDIARFLPLKSQFVLSGNVRDLQTRTTDTGQVAPVALPIALAFELYAAGYEQVLSYDPVHGIRAIGRSGAYEPQANAENLEALANHIETVLRNDRPTALLVDFASRLVVRSSSLSSAEHQFFSRALVHSHAAKARPHGPQHRPFFNTILWIVEKEGDLPDWLWVGNPRIRHVPVPKPDHSARRALASGLLKSLPGQATPEDLKTAEKTFVEETEGLLMVDLAAIVQLGRTEQVPVTRISDAVRRYKVGVTEDPWQKLDRDKIRNGYSIITQRVRGQDHAATHMLDIVKRAVIGVGASKRGGRPRGVAFLAGPTGVGKTELAKTITQLLFGDESAYIRFDMSEFSAEHADQRLLGAPPGYVGYDVGGELTNAIREKPFSVVLFDEIEKAHPRILDKFLQILDDGVLTSGRGDRVYFSEALIVFTSNLGIYRTTSEGERVPNVNPEDPLPTVTAQVRSQVDHHFKVVLNRPEILNRIGENIIVFDFIRPDVAIQIFEQMVTSTLQELDVRVELRPEAKQQLRTLCLADLSNGGRGIRNQVEAHLVNPLARALFETEGSDFAIIGVESNTLRLEATQSTR
jgi:ATP-dependent Clp protease ATP-binding subunit ClpA